MASDLTNLTGRLFVDMKIASTKALDLSIPSDTLIWRNTMDWIFGNGPGAMEADQIFHDTRLLAAAASEDLNLLTLLNPFTTAINLARVRAVIIKNKSLGLTPIVPARIRVGGAAANEWVGWFAAAGDKEIIEPGILGNGGISIHACPLDGWTPPLDATHKMLKVENLNTAPGAWTTLTAYNVTDVVHPVAPNGFQYRCSVAGTTAAGEPTWPTVLGATVVDGGVTWVCVCMNDALYEIIVLGVTA